MLKQYWGRLTLQTFAILLPSNIVELLIMDTPKSGQPPYNGHTVHPLPIYCSYISTSEERMTSEQWTKCLPPICPLYRGSTVFHIYLSINVSVRVLKEEM